MPRQRFARVIVCAHKRYIINNKILCTHTHTHVRFIFAVQSQVCWCVQNHNYPRERICIDSVHWVYCDSFFVSVYTILGRDSARIFNIRSSSESNVDDTFGKSLFEIFTKSYTEITDRKPWKKNGQTYGTTISALSIFFFFYQ